ncbi:hypothetical protein QYM36_013741 [Artemia franciscana]|uniref:Uncharacterized protein n=1 Tax=Artemia franciscana TaxID=6661 RepID=A0AA88L2E9_ARTSF|nr:hypothetical protein QYM36_013741 [Artemia franciscana]
MCETRRQMYALEKDSKENELVPLSNNTVLDMTYDLANYVENELLKRKKNELFYNSTSLRCITTITLDVITQTSACKRIPPELSTTLNDAAKIMNFIKSCPINCRLFRTLCEDFESFPVALLLHIEVGWLS